MALKTTTLRANTWTAVLVIPMSVFILRPSGKARAGGGEQSRARQQA